MLDFPTDDLYKLADSNPTAALIMAMSCLNDNLEQIIDRLELLISATKDNI